MLPLGSAERRTARWTEQSQDGLSTGRSSGWHITAKQTPDKK